MEPYVDNVEWSITGLSLPETKTVSCRLTRRDYRVFRGACNAMNSSMHRVIRLLIGAWLVDLAMQSEAPIVASENLRRAVENDRARRDGHVIPLCWTTGRDSESYEPAPATHAVVVPPWRSIR